MGEGQERSIWKLVEGGLKRATAELFFRHSSYFQIIMKSPFLYLSFKNIG